jgi:purine-nucleoside phosphorylase
MLGAARGEMQAVALLDFGRRPAFRRGMPAPESTRVQTAAAHVRAHRDLAPKVGLVLGSGLGGYADTLVDPTKLAYEHVPGMPRSRVEGHAGNLVLGKVHGMPVVAMQGRVHLYEGHSPADVVFGARLMIALGARTLLVTNAAGGCGDGMAAGDLMVIDDHLNMTGQSPLTGENDAALGVRFPDLSEAYDARLRALADRVAGSQGFSLRHGVYAGNLGPAYETPAEVRMARTLGAHAVGMSTVLEVIAARHMGARVLGLSCITNLAAGISAQPLSHDEVTETANRVKGRFTALVDGILAAIAKGEA